jgi:hypothetical protein
MMKQEYSVQIYNGLKAFLSLFLIFIFILAIIIYIAVALQSPLGGTIGFVLACGMPFLFQKSLKARFTEDAVLQFDEEAFSITRYNRGNESRSKSATYEWDKIKAYKFYFTASKLTCLDLYLKDGKRLEFPFKDNKNQEEAISVGKLSIFNIFRTFIKIYNSRIPQAEAIQLRPPFLTTHSGALWLSFVATLLVAAIIFLIIDFSGSFGFLFMGLFTFLPLLVKRKNDRRYFEKISQLG